MPDNPYDALFEPANPRERVHRVASRFGISPDIADDFTKVINLESGASHYDRAGRVKRGPVTRSGDRAIGASQIMPATAKAVDPSMDPFKEDDNYALGLRYFAQGGNDPTARRLHYFGGPGAARSYQRSGRIPNIDDRSLNAVQYVQATGGTQQRQDQPSNPYDALFQDAAQTPVSLTTNDAAWHFGMTPEQAQRMTRRQQRVLTEAVAEDQRKKAAGQQIAPPNLAYKNEMRQRAGLAPLKAVPTAGLFRQFGQQRSIDQEQRENEAQVRKDVINERSRLGMSPLGYPTGESMLRFISSPVQTITDLFKPEEEKIQRETAERLHQQQIAAEPEVTKIRKEYGSMPSAVRSIIAPVIGRGASGLLKVAGGVTSALGIAPNHLSDWANKRAEIIEMGSVLPPLSEQRGLSSLVTGDIELKEAERGIPEKVLTGVADLGVGLGQIILLKKATGLSFPNLLALEAAAKNNDKPVGEQLIHAGEGYALGSALDSHLGRAANAALFGIPTAAQTGYEVSEGRMSPLDAAIQTGIQAGAGAILTPGNRKASPEPLPEPIAQAAKRHLELTNELLRIGTDLMDAERNKLSPEKVTDLRKQHDEAVREILPLSRLINESGYKINPIGEVVRQDEEFPSILANQALGDKVKGKQDEPQIKVEPPAEAQRAERYVESEAGGVRPESLTADERAAYQKQYDALFYQTPHHSSRQNRRRRGEGKGQFVRGFREQQFQPTKELPETPQVSPQTETITTPEQASGLDRKLEARADKPSISVSDIEKPPEIAPDQSAGTRAAKLQDSIPEIEISATPDTEKQASGVERRPLMGERGFPKTAEAAGYQGGTDRDYLILTNKESLDKAEKEIVRVGADQAAADLAHVQDVGAPEIATGILLMQHYERKGDINRAVNVASDVARKLTKAGQTVQAASLISRLSPEGVLLHAQKLLKGKPLAEETANVLVQQAKAVTDAEKLLAEIQKQRPDVFGPNGEILPRSSKSRNAGSTTARTKIGTLQDRLVSLEESARARIEARKGQGGIVLSAGGLGSTKIAADLGDFVIIGAAKLARKGITRSIWLAEMAKEASAFNRHDLRRLYRESYEMYERERKQFQRESRMRGAEREDRGERPPSGPPTPTELREQGPLSLDEYDRVIAERTEAQKAAQRAHRELARTYQDLTRGKLQRIANTAVGLRRANLLTAVKTHLRNITSNIGFTIVSEEGARPMAALADMVARRTKGTGLRTTGGLSIPATSKALYAAVVKEGPRRAVDIILGREVLPLEGYRSGSESMGSKMQLNEADSGFKVLDTYINTVFRTLEAEDALFKVYAFRRELSDIARSQAQSERAKDPSVNVRQRAKELQANPTDAMQIEAATYADYATFQNKNIVSSGIGAFKRFTEPVGGKFLVEQIAPFDRTPTNIIARALENSPLGLISAARKYRRIGTGAKTVAGEIAKEAFTRQEQKDFARTFGRASTGTMLAALAMTLAAKGLLSGASDYDDDREEYMRKRRQYGGGGMLRIPGTRQRVSIIDTPVGKSMATAAAMYEQLNNPENSWEQAITKSGRAALNAYVLDQPLIRGLRDLGETKSMGEAAAQYGTTFVPGSQMLKSVAEVADPEARQYRGQGPAAQFRTLTPGRYGRGALPIDTAIDREERGGLRRRALRAMDPFNVTTEGRGPRKRSESAGPEGWPMQKELDRLGITINAPQRIKPGKYDKFKAETEEEYQARRQAEADGVKRELQRLEGMDYYKNLPPRDQEAEIRAAIKAGRESVRYDMPAKKRQQEALP